MTRILIYSDLHLEHRAFEAPQDLDYDIVVLAGDIASNPVAAVAWANATFSKAKAIVYVPGNHEFHGGEMRERLRAMVKASEPTKVYVLDNGELHVGGIRFLGCTLWTDFRLHIETTFGLASDKVTAMRVAARDMNDYRFIKVLGEQQLRDLDPMDTLSLHVEQRQWLLDAIEQPFDGPTVVVTHMAPHRKSLAPHYAQDWVSAAFVSEMDPRFFKVPKLWVHGHTHTSFDYSVDACRVVCNPRGYPMRGGGMENNGFRDDLVIEISRGA